MYECYAVEKVATSAGPRDSRLPVWEDRWNMAWASPQYSHKRVNAAGDTLIAVLASDDELEQAYAIIDNWRASHSLPLNTFQIGLRRNAKAVDPQALIAQRIKRLPSIDAKLRRFPNMKLSQMQDIGGCRAIVRTMNQVYDLVQRYRKCRFKHKLHGEKDYIATPAISGYRSVHLIYRYYDHKHPKHNGLRIEIQLRSRLQHAWATAVEIVGTFTQQALKSSQGQKEWLHFFALVGSIFALREKTTLVLNTPNNKVDLIAEAGKLYKELDVDATLRAYGSALEFVKRPGLSKSDYFLLVLDQNANTITAYGYTKDRLEDATQQYMSFERDIGSKPGVQIVLVSVHSLKSLRTAYPNYFLDAGFFAKAVTAELTGQSVS